jgi:aldose 1-epimerase
MNCQSIDFGTTKAGDPVRKYTITNSTGSSVSILNYGGIIQQLNVPDAEGTIKNVVLGFDNIQDYEEKSPYFGCITGRIGGRISGSTFTIGDTIYQLAKNDGDNNLHGGPMGLDKRVWSVSQRIEDTYCELVLNYLSDHLDQGFPGTVDMVVTYRFNEDNQLTIKYKASTDIDTILTLTNHTYFNLSGDPSTTILDHQLTIPADRVTQVGTDIIPIGTAAVAGTPFDFTSPHAIGERIDTKDTQLLNAGGYDHAFILNKNDGEIIVLEDPKSKRRMEITTTEACVVCYSGNFLNNDLTVQENVPLQKRSGVCLETQYYPDAINQDFFPTKILQPGDFYRYETTFSFK